MGDNSVINFGELSRPATVLIEKISEAVGGLFKPYQIIRVAKAEAEAEQIKAASQIQISDLQRRAFYRFLEEEAKRQKNMEDITQHALPLLKEQSRPDKVEDDWITNFFDRGRLISDQQMQQLWARILAGEANVPGSFSKRTVNLLSDVDKADAELFTRLCGFGWTISSFSLVIYDANAEMYNKQGIDFTALAHLETAGLIKFETFTGFRLLNFPKKIRASYFGTSVDLELPQEVGNALDVGHVMLTRAGEELASVCACKPVEGFVDYVRPIWTQRGYIRQQDTGQTAPSRE